MHPLRRMSQNLDGDILWLLRVREDESESRGLNLCSQRDGWFLQDSRESVRTNGVLSCSRRVQRDGVVTLDREFLPLILMMGKM